MAEEADEWIVPKDEWVVPDAPKAGPVHEPPSAGSAALAGALDTASFGFHDEIRGASKASGLPEWMGGYRAPVGAARLAYEGLTGPGEATKTYEAARDETRRMRKEAEEAEPEAFLAGQIGGSVAAPGLAAAKAVKAAPGAWNAAKALGARSLNSGKVAAIQGGLYGAGSGEDLGDRVTRAAIGAPVSGAIGIAATPVVEGALQVGKYALKPLTSTFRNAINPDEVAAARILTAREQAKRSDPNAVGRLTDQELQANVRAGGPATVLDTAGESGRAVARAAANLSPEGRGKLSPALDERFNAQSERMSDWARHNFNFPDAKATQEALDKSKSAALDPLYKKAYKEGDRVHLWDDDLQSLAQAPEVQNAIRMAVVKFKNERVAAGQPKPTGAFNIAGGETTLKGTDKYTVSPSLQLWDYVKQSLDDMGDRTSKMFAKQIRDHIDGMLIQKYGKSSYQEARSTAETFFGARDALEAGQKFVTEKFMNAEARDAIAKMSPLEKKLFQDGFVDKYIKVLNETPNRADVMKRIGASNAATERLHIALGPAKTKELEATIRVENIMNAGRNAVQSGSTTARQLAELGLAGATVGAGEFSGLSEPKSLLYGALVYGAAKGRRAIDERVAHKISEMMLSKDPAVLQRGIKLVANNGRIMDQLRLVDSKIARITAPQVSGSAPTPGRTAENESETPVTTVAHGFATGGAVDEVSKIYGGGDIAHRAPVTTIAGGLLTPDELAKIYGQGTHP